MVESEATQSLKMAASYLQDVQEAVDQGLERDETGAIELIDTIDLAMKQIDKAERIDPSAEIDESLISQFRAHAFGLRGTVEYNAFGKRSAAISSLKKSIEMDDNIHIAHYAIGVIYADCGKKEDSLRHLRKAVELAPDNMEYRKTLDRLEHVSSVGLKLGAFRGSWKVFLVLSGLSLLGLIMAFSPGGDTGTGIFWFILFSGITVAYWMVKSR